MTQIFAEQALQKSAGTIIYRLFLVKQIKQIADFYFDIGALQQAVQAIQFSFRQDKLGTAAGCRKNDVFRMLVQGREGHYAPGYHG